MDVSCEKFAAHPGVATYNSEKKTSRKTKISQSIMIIATENGTWLNISRQQLGIFHSNIALRSCVGPWPKFHFLNLYTIIRTTFDGGSSGSKAAT